MTDPMEPLTTPLRFAARDGWPLMGDLTLPPDAAPPATTAILISAGTGFPRRFYRHFAAWLAAQGAVVLTYDYRGIGDSGPGDLATSGIDYPDWGRLDMPAALDALCDAAPNLPIGHVAHSVGGHFIGLMPNHDRFDRHAFVSVGTGYFGGHHKRFWPAEAYFWWGMGGYNLLRHGYIKQTAGWQGEPLPPDLFRTWRRWSHRRAYFRPDLMAPSQTHYYDDVRAPIRSWVFADDPIATPRSARDLLDVYPNAPQEITINPASAYGVRRIGHDGAFRPGREALWNDIWTWLAGGEAGVTPVPTPASGR